MTILKPNYNSKNIVNLMSSIAQTFGGKTYYNTLDSLTPEELRGYKNIILLIIDGLGYNFLIKHKSSFLKSKLKDKLESVFLSTTACANTTFDFGVPPQQTALTGWFMNLKEAGMVTKILPFSPRLGGEPLSKQGLDIEKIINEKSFMQKIKGKKYKIFPEELTNSDFTQFSGKGSKIVGYKNFKDMLNKIEKIIKIKGKKYIHAYWPDFDGVCHEKGVGSKDSEKKFKKLDKSIEKFSKQIKNTLLIITADHGIINTPKERVLYLKDHEKLQECLSLPLCGDGRVVYCYVKLSKAKQFEEYITEKFSEYCYLIKSEELIDQNYFGLAQANKKLYDRIGDYTLIMKENYIFKDQIEAKRRTHIGHHAGITEDEMLVPLILIKS